MSAVSRWCRHCQARTTHVVSSCRTTACCSRCGLLTASRHGGTVAVASAARAALWRRLLVASMLADASA